MNDETNAGAKKAGTAALLRHHGRAGKLPEPLTWQQFEAIAHEDHALATLDRTPRRGMMDRKEAKWLPRSEGDPHGS